MIATPAPAPGDASHSAAPVWLEFSGLPQALHEVRKNAWIVFKKLVELDCERHPAAPGVVVASPAEIALRTGFDAAAVAKTCDGLRRKRLIRVFMPDDPEDDMLYEIAAPLPVPAPAERIEAALEERFGALVARAPRRYWSATEPGGSADAATEERQRRAVELYMSLMSLSVNSFVVDELGALARRYPVEMIEAAMRSAAAAGERHVSGIYRRLKIVSAADELAREGQPVWGAEPGGKEGAPSPPSRRWPS